MYGDKRGVGRYRRLQGLACATVAAIAASGATAGHAMALPDGRAYERVSPREKNLGDVVTGLFSHDDGNQVAFTAGAAIQGSHGAVLISTMVGERTSAGWSTVPASGRLAPVFEFASYTAYSTYMANEDFTRFIVKTQAPLVPEDRDGRDEDFYLVEAGSGKATFLSRPETLPDTVVDGRAARLVGASRDLRRIYMHVPQVLVAGAPENAIYEWSDGALRIASRLPGGTPTEAAPGAWPSAYSGTHGDEPGGGSVAHGGAHTVSDDGRRMFFYPSFGGAGQVYMSQIGSDTVHVSASHRPGFEGQDTESWFIAATHSGSTVFLASDEQISADATAGGGLYRYSVENDTMELVTPAFDPGGAGISHAMASDDGSTVYFVASSQLNGEGVAGERNLYVWSETGTRFIATLAPDDTETIERVTRDGRYAVISSTSSFGGAPTNGRRSLYRYDLTTGALACVSCRADGGLSQGDAVLDTLNIGLPSPSTANAGRNITDDGDVYFSTDDRLVGDDLNAVHDVYEYDGSRVALISSGRGDSHSFVSDNSDDGRDVFFTTRDALVSDDDDGGLRDLYDARVGGGFPGAPDPPAPCRGDGCQGALPAPVQVPHAQSTASGAGNVVSPAGDRSDRTRTFSLPKLSAAKVRALSRTGGTTIAVRLTGGGKVTIKGRARIGKRTRTVVSAVRTVRSSKPVTANMKIRLSQAARREIRRGRRVRLTLEVRVDGVDATREMAITLTRKASK